jgi:hypothetical protein
MYNDLFRASRTLMESRCFGGVDMRIQQTCRAHDHCAFAIHHVLFKDHTVLSLRVIRMKDILMLAVNIVAAVPSCYWPAEQLDLDQ